VIDLRNFKARHKALIDKLKGTGSKRPKAKFQSLDHYFTVDDVQENRQNNRILKHLVLDAKQFQQLLRKYGFGDKKVFDELTEEETQKLFELLDEEEQA